MGALARRFPGKTCAVNKHLSEYLGDRCSWEGERYRLSLAEQEPFALMFTRRMQRDVIFNSPAVVPQPLMHGRRSD